MADLTGKLLTGVRLGLTIVAILGGTTAGLQLYLLNEVVSNGKRIEKVESDMIDRIGKTKDTLLDKISVSANNISNELKVNTEYLALLKGALGDSPARIQNAAIKVESAASAIARLELSADQINKFGEDFDKLEEDVDQIKIDIVRIKDILGGKEKNN